MQSQPPGGEPVLTIDASALVALLIDGGTAGNWVLVNDLYP